MIQKIIGRGSTHKGYLCIIILIIGGGINCKRNMPFQHTGFRPDMIVTNFTSTNYQASEIVWKLEATESSYYYNENRSIAKEIVLNYYENGRIATVVNAEMAIINTNSKDIDLIGNVDMLSTSGNRLLTSRIKWNSMDKLLNTDEAVKILKKNGDVIKGIGLCANYNLEDYEIKRKVVAITRDQDNN